MVHLGRKKRIDLGAVTLAPIPFSQFLGLGNPKEGGTQRCEEMGSTSEGGSSYIFIY